MQLRSFLAGPLLALALSSAPALAEKPPARQPTIYEMKRVQVRDLPGKPWVYVIGYSAFATLEALKAWVGQIPAGDTLRWDPSGDIPVTGDPLGDPAAAAELTRFCKDKGIILVRIPRP